MEKDRKENILTKSIDILVVNLEKQKTLTTHIEFYYFIDCFASMTTLKKNNETNILKLPFGS